MKNLNLICFLLLFGWATVFTACGGSTPEEKAEETTETMTEETPTQEMQSDTLGTEADSLGSK